MQYPRPVAVTWQTTFGQLRPTAAAILRLTAFLAPDPIPRDVREGGGNRPKAAELLRRRPDRETEQVPVDEAVADLPAYLDGDTEGETSVVHRMVQEALRSTLPGERRRAWIELSLKP